MGHDLLEVPSPDALTLPKVAKYRKWDGVEGFSRVLASRGPAPGNDPALRLYEGESKFGGLVGQPVSW